VTHEASPSPAPGAPSPSDAALRARSAKWVGLGTIAVILAIGAVLIWRMSENHMPAPRIVATGSDVRPARPAPQMRPSPPGAVALAEPFHPLTEPADTLRSFIPAIQLAPPYDVIDSMTFRSQDVRIRLANISGVRRGDVCFGEDSLRFPCGLMGRASLANFMRTNPVTCYPTGQMLDSTTLVAQCFLAGVDLSEHQIRAGLARPYPGVGGTYLESMRQASEIKAGAWNGLWKLMDLPEDKRDGLQPPAPSQAAERPSAQ
jgi:endonuclease YncB( thermonuclease family)